MLLDNYAETVFLKRFGVRNLPFIYLVNALLTFIIMNYVMVILRRTSTIRLLRWLNIICPVTVIALRFFLQFPNITYPLFYIFKTQYESLLLLIFWNLGNELFNTRQSKRLFPLIMAGGVLGRIGGSLFTGYASKFFLIDNIVFVYAFFQAAAFLVTIYLEVSFTALGGHHLVKKVKRKSEFIDEMKSIVPLSKNYPLFRILAIVTLASNLMIPLLNYQFNFIVDKSFMSEGGLIAFFGWFRSAFNGISLVLLLVAGRFFSAFGLTTAILFHPFNYILVFLSLLFHFKLGSAIYGRVSTNVIRSTLNSPSMAAIMGLFPRETGARIRPILRGTVVRIGVLVGSLILIFSKDILKPQFLSILGALFGVVWLIAVLRLRKSYVDIVVGMLLEKRVDFERLGATDVKALFRDTRVVKLLFSRFQEARGDECLWHLELLKLAEYPGLEDLVLETLPEKEERVQRRLVAFVRAGLTANHLGAMRKVMDTVGYAARATLLEIMTNIPHDESAPFFREAAKRWDSGQLHYLSLLGLLKCTRGDEAKGAKGDLIRQIDSAAGKELRFLMQAVGRSEDADFIPPILKRFTEGSDGLERAYILEALYLLNAPSINDLILPIIESPLRETPLLRKVAIECLRVDDRSSVEQAMKLLLSRHRKVRRLMLQKIADSGLASSSDLLKCLRIPKRDVREGVSEMIRRIGVSQMEVREFINGELFKAYRIVFIIARLEKLNEHPIRAVLLQKLEEDILEIVHSILFVLEFTYGREDLRRIRRIIFSDDIRARSNAVEALEELLSSTLAQRLIPLLDEIPYREKERKGGKFFPIEQKTDMNVVELVQFILSWAGPVLNTCVISYAVLAYPEENWEPTLTIIAESPFENLRQTAVSLIERFGGAQTAPERSGSVLTLMDKILHLKNIQIFSDLKINELAAIAAITKEIHHEEGDVVIREGDLGDSFYLVIDGEVAVLKAYHEADEVLLARMGPGEYFGEMALFEAKPRSATVKTLKSSLFLFLDKEEFEDLVEEYPKIALNIGRVLSNRLREAHGMLLEREEEPPDTPN